MALELARHGIRVNALAPGYVMTDLNEAFLASEAGDKLRSRIPSRRFSVPAGPGRRSCCCSPAMPGGP
ncbi:SDR family oxidoreductase [Pseudomonas aeruginosa]|nr:SDR family oxidoreductase [Pseudomonas aeruginosa]